MTAALPRHHTASRHDLITETSRLAFEIEAADRAGACSARLRVEFHTAMAELLSRTEAWCPAAAERMARTRQDHLERAEAARMEMGRAEA